jgi:hypothetical protein
MLHTSSLCLYSVTDDDNKTNNQLLLTLLFGMKESIDSARLRNSATVVKTQGKVNWIFLSVSLSLFEGGGMIKHNYDEKEKNSSEREEKLSQKINSVS